MPATSVKKGKLTEWQITAYVRRGGSGCPRCGSNNINGGGVEVDIGGAWQSVSCTECELEWTDIYNLRNVTNIKYPEPENNKRTRRPKSSMKGKR